MVSEPPLVSMCHARYEPACSVDPRVRPVFAPLFIHHDCACAAALLFTLSRGPQSPLHTTPPTPSPPQPHSASRRRHPRHHISASLRLTRSDRAPQPDAPPPTTPPCLQPTRARDPANRPAFEVRLVQVVPIFDGNSGESVHSRSPRRGSIHPPPAFGSSPNLEALALEAIKSEVQDGDSAVDAGGNISSVSNSTKYCCILQPRLTGQYIKLSVNSLYGKNKLALIILFY
ncbi:hypothetical protein ACS0TY_025002 [Phlomoides rotata]